MQVPRRIYGLLLLRIRLLNRLRGTTLMGYVEIFRIDNEGAGWIDLSQANADELFNLEVGLLNEGALFTTKEAE